MDLAKIVLEQVANSEYRGMHRFWYPNSRSALETHSHARMRNPLTFANYEEAIREFLDYEISHLITANRDGRWKRFFKNNPGWNIGEVADIARQDEKKIGHLEFYFRPDPGSNNEVKMCFTERDGLVVGFELSVPGSFLKQPNGHKPQYRPDLFALWVPQEYRPTNTN